MKRATIISAVMMALLSSAPAMAETSALAASDRTMAAAQTDVIRYAQRQISPREAKSIALSRVPGGEVVDIRRSGDTYRVRIIARDGRVIDIVVDANTGRIR